MEENEEARLAALRSYQVLDRPRTPVLDDVTRLAASMFDIPMAAVFLVGRDRQRFAGYPNRLAYAIAQVPRSTTARILLPGSCSPVATRPACATLR